jgi:(p)ppGpp synthase/HD superfamily hydrolase
MKYYYKAKLQEAFYWAVELHSYQVDKAGVPYIHHPMFVMSQVKTDIQRIVAVLHDVVEDTIATLDEVRFRFGDEVADAVDALTRRKNESYFAFIRRVKLNRDAKHVKFHDIKHNMDLSRIDNPTQKDYNRVKKYEKALDILLGLEE